MQPLFLLAALAIIGSSMACDWDEIEQASILIEPIPGGYRAVFMGGNCTFSGEGSEMLPALDALYASMWCDWTASEA